MNEQFADTARNPLDALEFEQGAAAGSGNAAHAGAGAPRHGQPAAAVQPDAAARLAALETAVAVLGSDVKQLLDHSQALAAEHTTRLVILEE